VKFLSETRKEILNLLTIGNYTAKVFLVKKWQ
jgi:endonuclease III